MDPTLCQHEVNFEVGAHVEVNYYLHSPPRSIDLTYAQTHEEYSASFGWLRSLVPCG